jgi:protoporphyrinogen/coproporphyrinogen III oxidase
MTKPIQASVKQVAVIGAGLTGLTVAFYLKKYGFEVTVFDALPRTGGVIQSVHEKGFVVEAGPNTGVLGNPEVVELFSDLEGACALEKANPAAKSRWIWKGLRWEPLPSGLWAFLTTPLFSIKDKFLLMGEPFRRKGTNPNETLDKMVVRRLGKGFLDYAVDPFVAGVYAGDASYLVPRFALPKLYLLEQKYGSFIKGAIAKGREPKTARDKLATKEVFSAKGGLGNLVAALEKKIGPANFRLGVKALEVEKSCSNTGRPLFHLKGMVNGELFEHKTLSVISTVGAHALPTLMPFLGDRLLRPMADLVYAKVVLVTLGFDKWEGIPLNAFGGLVPSVEKREILGVLFTSSFFEGRAPKDGALLSVFLGGMRQPYIPEMNDDQIMAIVEREICATMSLDDFNPSLVKIFRYNHAIPQYGASSEQRLKAVADIEYENTGLWIAGNLRDGIGMADRVQQGRNLAQVVNDAYWE